MGRSIVCAIFSALITKRGHFVLSFRKDKCKVRCGSQSTTYWRVPRTDIVRIEPRFERGEVVEVLIHTEPDSLQMLAPKRFQPEQLQQLLLKLSKVTQANSPCRG